MRGGRGDIVDRDTGKYVPAQRLKVYIIVDDDNIRCPLQNGFFLDWYFLLRHGHARARGRC